jgi:hypothetical protein
VGVAAGCMQGKKLGIISTTFVQTIHLAPLENSCYLMYLWYVIVIKYFHCCHLAILELIM